MESNIEFTTTFLNCSAHLWDKHFARTDEMKSLMLEDLKNVIAKHERISMNFQKKNYTALDKLREAATVPKLAKNLKDVYKILDSIGKL